MGERAVLGVLGPLRGGAVLGVLGERAVLGALGERAVLGVLGERRERAVLGVLGERRERADAKFGSDALADVDQPVEDMRDSAVAVAAVLTRSAVNSAVNGLTRSAVNSAVNVLTRSAAAASRYVTAKVVPAYRYVAARRAG
jgi:hypothetical protein